MMSNSGFEIQVVSMDGLPEIEHDWELLASQAVELNPSYEPWMLAPALDALGMTREVRVALMWYRNPATAKAPLLAGFLPFITTRPWKGLPVSAAENVNHIYYFSGVPLLHREHSRPALDAYFDWLRSPASDSSIVLFRGLPADGQFHQLLVDVLHSRSLVHTIERRYTRALYKYPADHREYIAAQFSGRTLKHLRRQKELLSEQGTLEVCHLTPEDNVTNWVDDFLRLEAAGWKGAAGTALGSMASHETFFRSVTGAAHGRQRLKMSGLSLDGRFIAARTAFRSGDGSHLFKIAYDEAYAKYSPGTLLELECMLAGGVSGEAWEDSCTSADNTVYKRLWRDRRTIEDVAISAGSAWGDFALSVVPCLRFVKSRLRGLRKGARSNASQAGLAHAGSAKE